MPLFPLLPHVQQLILHGNYLTSRAVRAICAHPPAQHLERLTLWRNEIAEEGFLCLADAIREGRVRTKVLIMHDNGASTRAREQREAACDDAPDGKMTVQIS